MNKKKLRGRSRTSEAPREIFCTLMEDGKLAALTFAGEIAMRADRLNPGKGESIVRYELSPEPKKFEMTPEHWGALNAFDWAQTAQGLWSKMTTDERYVIYCAAEAEMEASRLYNLVVKALEKRRGKQT